MEVAPYMRDVCDTISGDSFAVHRCPNCGNAVTVPQPADIDSYYGTRYYGGRHSFTARFCIWRRRRMVKRATPAKAGRLLDFGCGDGGFLDAMRTAGWKTTGVERDGAPARAEQPVLGSIEEAADCGPYQCVTLWHVLEHVPDPARHAAALRPMISPEGVLMIAVPDFGGLQARLFGRHWLHLDVPRHLHHFTRRGLIELLRSAGFETVRVTNLELEYDWFGWIQSALNTMMETPNVLFDSLTGKPRRGGRLQVAAAFAMGALLALPALAFTLASSAIGRGGTLVVTARPAATVPERVRQEAPAHGPMVLGQN